ncbi:hypothetical protein, partial [Thiothrix sp.]|uniref:hypothetical protein n=1 Tax=Thiothrix sp. TaxID=1032 RepID=UPI00257EC580
YQAGTHGFSVATKTGSVANCIVSMQIYMRSPWSLVGLVLDTAYCSAHHPPLPPTSRKFSRRQQWIARRKLIIYQ